MTEAQQGARGRAPRRRRAAVVVVLLTALVTGGLGAAVGAWQSRGATATAVVLVAPLEGNPFSPEGQGEELVNLESEAQLVRSENVATLVARDLGQAVDVSDLLAGVSVAVPVNTQILEINYTAGSGAVAASRAQAFAEQFLSYRQERTENLTAGRRSRVLTQVEEETRRLNRLVASLDDAQSPSEQTLLAGRVEALSAQIAELRGQLAELSVGSIDPGQVVTPATAPTGGSPLVLLGGIGGLLVGLVGGVSLVVARGWLSGGLRRPEEVTTLGLPVAARVPVEELYPGYEGESLRLLRAAVLARLTPGAQGTCVVVARTTSVTGEDPAPLTLALAHAAARSAVPTVLIDLTGAATTGPGLLEVLRGRADLDAALAAPAEHLEVLAVGADDAALDDLVVAPAMRRVLRGCTARAELVLVATPPLDTPTGRALLEMADALVAEVRPTDRPEHVDAVVSLVEVAGLGWSRAAWVDPAPHGVRPAALDLPPGERQREEPRPARPSDGDPATTSETAGTRKPRKPPKAPSPRGPGPSGPTTPPPSGGSTRTAPKTTGS